jgi:hypothetical protein
MMKGNNCKLRKGRACGLQHTAVQYRHHLTSILLLSLLNIDVPFKRMRKEKKGEGLGYLELDKSLRPAANIRRLRLPYDAPFTTLSNIDFVIIFTCFVSTHAWHGAIILLS